MIIDYDAAIADLQSRVEDLERVPEYNFVDVVREIRNVSGLPLKESKAIGDRLRSLGYLKCGEIK